MQHPSLPCLTPAIAIYDTRYCPMQHPLLPCLTPAIPQAENMLLSHDGEGAELRLVDFGLAAVRPLAAGPDAETGRDLLCKSHI
jgi:hypothetical protein